MKCIQCENELVDGAKFCSVCGTPVMADEEFDEVIGNAYAKAQEKFDDELESHGIDIESERSEEGQSDKRKSAREKLKQMQEAVRKGAETTIVIGKNIGEGTSKAIQKTVEVSEQVTDKTAKAAKRTKEVSADIKEKVSTAVDKTVDVSTDVVEIATKAGEQARGAIKKTKETMDDLGQVGVIITQRSLDVVRASITAVEMVVEFLNDKNSNYEVGNFITGVGIPPYLEIEFHKKKGGITMEERKLIDEIRESSISPNEMRKNIREMIPPMEDLKNLPDDAAEKK
ncbi:MAG TPA: zinc-ribbon domain-containing protein [bacterium]|jgi:hypothetical protein